MKQNRHIICLHGFLGLGSDWNTVLPENINAWKQDLFSPDSTHQAGGHASETTPPLSDFYSLSNWLNALAQQTSSTSKNPNHTRNVILGYSLGGRIALATLAQKPEIWSGAIIVSAHPGLTSTKERELRIQSDEKWATLFETSEWNSLLSKWNSQPVLKNTADPNTDRLEKDFSRQRLASSLRSLSLGRQKDFRCDIQSLKIPVLWIVGENDRKFLDLATEVCSLNSGISLVILPNAGHRAPWDQPVKFKKAVSKFLTGQIP